MNDNDILLATQNGNNLVLTTEEGDFPAGSKVFYYKNSSGNDKSVDLTSLTDGSDLFTTNTNLKVDWDVSIPNLAKSNYMFSYCTNLTSFSGDLPNLAKGNYMFSNCTNLTSFSGDLPNLTDGSYMFSMCTSLTSFTGNIPKLKNATWMFTYCKLDKKSVHHIAQSIPASPGGLSLDYNISLGIDASLKNDPDVAADLTLIGTTKKWKLTTEWN